MNTPHNPTGRIYPLEQLRALGDLLARRSAGRDRPILLVSDEPYNRIVFDGIDFHSPAEVYPNTIIDLLVRQDAARSRDADRLRHGPADDARPRSAPPAILLAQIATGYAFPNALLQHAIEDLERLSIDIGALERRRDRLVPALRAMGYEATMPEGTFYVMARSPIPDDMAFADLLATHGALVLPGHHRRGPGLVPDQPDRVGGDGRARPAQLRVRPRGRRLRLTAGSLTNEPTARRDTFAHRPTPGCPTSLDSRPQRRGDTLPWPGRKPADARDAGGPTSDESRTEAA